MIAQVYVDLEVPHLDRVFDYDVPAALADAVRPGVRVKVRFAGRSRTGFVVGLSDDSAVEQRQPLAAVVSSEVVMPAAMVRLIRAVADHCAGQFMDVARLAVPPRSAAVERAVPAVAVDPGPIVTHPSPIDLYPTGGQLRQAVRAGHSPRAAWLVAPAWGETGDWAAGLAGLAADTVASGRSALLLVPDAKDCARLEAAVKQVVPGVPVARLAAEQGPPTRYRNYLAGLRGLARVMIGTRSAAYAPLPDLGLIAVWDEADSSFCEPRRPYPQLRDIVAIRAAQDGAGLVFAGRSWSAEIQAWVDQAWLTPLALPTSSVRFLAPAMRVASAGNRALDRDAYALSARIPHDVFDLIRAAVDLGPVLVWVPWAGARRNLSCAGCGQGLRCACGGAYAEVTVGQIACRWCGRGLSDWRCACGSTRWRAATVGSASTADELAQAFARQRVIRVDASQAAIESIGPIGPGVVVVATPGSEPPAAGGYAAGVVVDAAAYLARPDLRAAETAVRRWLEVAALVRPGQAGGTVMLVGPSTDRAIQAVIRLDPVGFSTRELADRQAAGLPPAVRLATFGGDADVLWPLARDLRQAGYETLGPTQDSAGDDWRLVARAPADRGDAFAAWLGDWSRRRSGGGRPGKLSWRLDPVDFG